MKPIYTAIATAEGGRTGHVRTSDGNLDLELRMPGAPNAGTATNPEQLFAAGYAACFESAMRMVARMKKVPLEKASITSHVTLGQDDAGGYMLAVELHASLPGLAREQAQELVDLAHQGCPYSRATRGNIEVKLFVD